MFKETAKIDKLFDDIHDGWLETQRGTLFLNDDPKFEKLEQACIDYLIYKGYKIVKPIESKYNVKKFDDLIHLFYAFSDKQHPELMNNYRNLAKDRKIASLFVEARMAVSGINKNKAMNECAEIIETIFTNEKDFNFEIPITFGILGQVNCGWITDKAVQIINKKKLNSENERRKELIASMDEKYDAEVVSFGDLDKILKNL